MTTMAEIVSDALQIMGKVSIGGSPASEDASYGLRVLNDMLHGWRAADIDIGHETLTGSETVNLLEEHIEGVKVLLAVNPRMVRRFGWTPDALTLQQARDAENALHAAYVGSKPAALDPALARMPQQTERWGR